MKKTIAMLTAAAAILTQAAVIPTLSVSGAESEPTSTILTDTDSSTTSSTLTEQQFAEMYAVDDAIAALTEKLGIEGYKERTDEEIQAIADEYLALLYQLAESGTEEYPYSLIQAASITSQYNTVNPTITFQYACDVYGSILVNGGFHPDYDGIDEYSLMYRVKDDGTAAITSYAGIVDDLVIPSTIDGYAVTEIDDNAFGTDGEQLDLHEDAYLGITSLEIESGITTIGENAFLNCKELKSVTLPDTLEEVGSAAFAGCDSLMSVTIPDSVTSFGDYSFGFTYQYEIGWVYPISGDGCAPYVFADYERMDDFTIYANSGSAAETYADQNGITFIPLTSVAEKCGDVNLDGEVSMSDVILLSKFTTGLVDFVDLQKKNADCNTDEGVSGNDALSLLRFVVQAINTLPEDSGSVVPPVVTTVVTETAEIPETTTTIQKQTTYPREWQTSYISTQTTSETTATTTAEPWVTPETTTITTGSTVRTEQTSTTTTEPHGTIPITTHGTIPITTTTIVYDPALTTTAYIADVQPTVKTIEMVGYSDALYQLAESDHSSAVITSVEELRAYLIYDYAENEQSSESFFGNPEKLDEVLARYDEAFFEENVLLCNAIYQGYGGGVMYAIDSVFYDGDQLNITYHDNYKDGDYECIVSGLLAQVVIPKEQFHASDVAWHYIQCEIAPVTNYDDTFQIFTESLNKSVIISNQDELYYYLKQITDDETIEKFLEIYDSAYFETNTMLISAFYEESPIYAYKAHVAWNPEQISVFAYTCGMSSTPYNSPAKLAIVTVSNAKLNKQFVAWDTAQFDMNEPNFCNNY